MLNSAVRTADHGAQFPFGKWNAYDAGIRTPLVAVWPGRIKPGTTAKAMVSWIDLLPTCLEAAGGKPPADLSGRSFLAVLRGEKDAHRDRVFLAPRPLDFYTDTTIVHVALGDTHVPRFGVS